MSSSSKRVPAASRSFAAGGAAGAAAAAAASAAAAAALPPASVLDDVLTPMERSVKTYLTSSISKDLIELLAVMAVERPDDAHHWLGLKLLERSPMGPFVATRRADMLAGRPKRAAAADAPAPAPGAREEAADADGARAEGGGDGGGGGGGGGGGQERGSDVAGASEK